MPWLRAAALGVQRVSPDVLADAEGAVARMEVFDRESAGWGVPFTSVLLCSESSASSQIEHLMANARRIALAALGDSSRPNATKIARNPAAPRAAVDLADRIGAQMRRGQERSLGSICRVFLSSMPSLTSATSTSAVRTAAGATG